MSLSIRQFMQVSMVAAFLAVAWLLSTAPKSAAADSATAIRGVLESQASAWNRGDLDQFMRGYARSAEASYISGDTELYGFDAIQKRYESKYGNHPDTMGQLEFSDLRVVALGSKNALCIGHWHLVREGKPDVRGVFSLVFVRGVDGWKILHDHTTAFQ